MDNLKQQQEEWFELNAPTGRLLGYPECCIKEFCNQPPEFLRRFQPTKDDIKRYQAAHVNGKFTGFFPCINHARQILAGKITLASLIKDREVELPPFPSA